MREIENKVKAVISEQLGISISKISNSQSFMADLGADSLDSVSLLMALEEEFNVEISDEDALKITTVQEAINYSIKISERNKL